MNATTTPATPVVKVSTDTRRTIRASVTAATALDKASGKFSRASAIALITIVDELGVGKDTGTVWTDTVASYGEHILKPASGRAYLSHVRKAIKIGKTTADVWEFLQLDTDKPRGLSTLGAWLKDEDKTSGLSESDPETGDTDKASKPADISALMARAIKALELVADVHKGGSILDAGQWQAFRTIAAGIERREVARIAPKVSAPKVSTVSAPKVSAPKATARK